MQITRRQLKAQYDRVVKLGWLPFFEEAAATITKGYYDTADLIAIGSRETNLDPKWLTKAGDNGNGFGLMQADKRSFPEFTRGDGWKDAKTGILFGAKVLMQKQRDYEQNIGKSAKVKSSKGGTFSYTGKAASGQTAQHIVISGYNCGRWSQYAYAKGQDIDKYSTQHDYGADVMERAAVIRTFLQPNSAVGDSKPLDTTISQTSPEKPGPDPAFNASTAEANSGAVVGEPGTSEPPPPENPIKVEEEVHIEKIEADTNPPEETKGLGATWAGIMAFLSTAGGGVIAFLNGAKTEIILGFFGAAAIIGAVYIWKRFDFANKDAQRQFEANEAEKVRAFEMQKLIVQGAQDDNKTTVRIV